MDGELRRQTLSDLLHRSAKRFPNKTAIICGDTAWSYATFDALCNRLATGLAARGVHKGTRINVCALTNAEVGSSRPLQQVRPR
jgi:fatty-acyl-CoA synthase